MKLKLHDLQIADAILKRLAYEINSNKIPRPNPRLVILLNGQLVAGDFFPEYKDGCPYIKECEQFCFDDYEYSLNKIMPPLDYHIVQRFYFREMRSKEKSIEFLFNNPDVLFLIIQEHLSSIKLGEGQPFIYNPRFLGQRPDNIKFLLLNKDTEYEVVSLVIDKLPFTL